MSPASIQDILTQRDLDAAAVATDVANAAAAQTALDGANTQEATDQTAVANDDMLMVSALTGAGGFAINPTPNADGTFTLYLLSTLDPVGWTSVNIPGIGATIPAAAHLGRKI